MKKIWVIVLSLVWFNFPSFAQDNSADTGSSSSSRIQDSLTREITFLGLPISGNANTLATALTKKGFTIKERTPKYWSLKGMFLDKYCDIYIRLTTQSKTVWQIDVFFPDQENWYTLKGQYQDICDKLSVKYDSPTTTYSFFSDPYYEGDGYELQALRLEKCTYQSLWEYKKGIISCGIFKTGSVNITYESADGAKLNDAEDLKKSQEEL
jgi:hypothetical protein